MKSCGDRRIGLDALLVCWGMGTWLGVNGLFVQLPLLVERLPEGWALPTSMTVAVASANVGILVYGLLKRALRRAADAHYIYGLLAVGTLALFLNAFLYQETATVGNSERSVAFLVLTFFAALVGCTSSVLFYPYLRYFRDVYLFTYLVGEGLSGFVPSILALVQGVGGAPECVPTEGDNSTLTAVYPAPLFSSTAFLIMLSALSAVSLTSFVIVDNLKTFDSERVDPSAKVQEEEVKEEDKREDSVNITGKSFISVMVVMVFINFVFNGVMPSIQSYSCMPYGNNVYHLSVTLSAMANPAVCLASVWLPLARGRVVALLLSAALAPLGYALATALLSPTPPLQHSAGGAALIVVSWVGATAAISYARMWVYAWARRGGARGMRACGVLTQVGSALGSLTMFAIVNYTATFTQPPTCPAPTPT